jgi:hypothetical protein
MGHIICGNCKNLLKFFVPESKDNRFWHRCSACGAINDLALDPASSGESKPAFKVVGVRREAAEDKN